MCGVAKKSSAYIDYWNIVLGGDRSVHRTRMIGGISPVRGVDGLSTGCLACNIILSVFHGKG